MQVIIMIRECERCHRFYLGSESGENLCQWHPGVSHSGCKNSQFLQLYIMLCIQCIVAEYAYHYYLNFHFMLFNMLLLNHNRKYVKFYHINHHYIFFFYFMYHSCLDTDVHSM